MLGWVGLGKLALVVGWLSCRSYGLSWVIEKWTHVHVCVESQKVYCALSHAPCHVTCRQGVRNNQIRGIPVAILPIYNFYGATMMIKGSL